MKKRLSCLLALVISLCMNAAGTYNYVWTAGTPFSTKVSSKLAFYYVTRDGGIYTSAQRTKMKVKTSDIVAIAFKSYQSEGECIFLPLKDVSSGMTFGPTITDLSRCSAVSRKQSNADCDGLISNMNDNGYLNTSDILNANGNAGNSAAYLALHNVYTNIMEGTYLPTLRELYFIYRHLSEINMELARMGGNKLSGWYWTSDMHYAGYRAWAFNMDDGSYFAQLTNETCPYAAQYGAPRLKVRPLLFVPQVRVDRIYGI